MRERTERCFSSHNYERPLPSSCPEPVRSELPQPGSWRIAAWCSGATRLLHVNYGSHSRVNAALENCGLLGTVP